ncbi:PTS sugar transporter subunit IIA [uncultured Fusobacterium sp.]|uniref:PTS sugar transporter subunit IIA n=1 Tax=uncultured Fusobacterium sp. TaxID=159267 RepID=UPI0025DA870A|nr:PTS sugar transporter subunit IIA [uncultured Fusobacterium sp.]
MYYDNLTINLLKHIGKNIKDIAKELNISERTIRYRIKDLNENLSLQNNSVYVEKKILKYKGDIFFLNNFLEKEEYIFNLEERVEIIILLLLFNSEGCKAEKILEILNISRSTLKNDLKIIREKFDEKKLEIISKANRGLIITGEEIEIRKFLLDKLRNCYVIKSEKITLEKNLNFLKKKVIEEFISNELIERVAKFFEKIKIDLKKSISDEAFQIIFIYILISLKRIYEDLKLNNCKNSQFMRSTEDYKVIKENIKILEDKNIKITEDEILKLTEFILGAHTYNFKYSFYENWILIEKFIDNLIFSMSREINRNLLEDKVLREGLINHIVPTIYRLKNNLELQESIANEIKEEYPNYFYKIKKLVEEIENYIGKKFSENEIAFLTVHFIIAIKRMEEKIQNHKQAIIVCGLGYGTSNLLKQEIEDLFDIEIKEVIPLNNLKSIKIEKLDYIISTIEIQEKNIEIPIIKVNTFLKQEDILNLLSYGIKNKKVNIEVNEIINIIKECAIIKDEDLLKRKILSYTSNNKKNLIVSKTLLELLPEKNIKLQVRVNSWQEAIEEAGNILLKNQYINSKYIQEMKDKILELGTYMIIDNKVLLPHGEMQKNVLKTGVAYIQLEKEIEFPGGLPIKHIFALCTINSEEHIKGLLELKEILEEENFKIKLENCLSDIEIINEIKKSLNNIN